MADIEQLIRAAAQRYHLNANIFRAQLKQESGLREGVTSTSGARDIAQFIPSTAKAYGVTLGDNNPADDIDGAARYMRDNLDRFGSYERALSAYNSGRPDAYKDPHFANGQTYNYVKAILGAAGSGSGSPRGGIPTTGSTTQVTANTTPGVSHQGDRMAAVAQWLQARNSGSHSQALLGLAGALTNIPSDTPGTTTLGARTTPGATPAANVDTSQTGAVADPSGKKVAAWIEPILAYARAHGWKGTINSGYRSYADQKRIYDSGVRPAAKPGTSNHEFTAYPGGAIDASDPETLARILARSPYAKKLVYAGAKDPVHFSHPHNGSY